ncbi:MAG TPA: DUF192 domain-containing protein [Nitrospirales bacterium]|nr:DUF192 domain-containing protein [Nitrospirales bacterium]
MHLWQIVLILLASAPAFASPDGDLLRIQTPNGSTIMAEIADTPVKRAQGLMFRESLAPNRGMLFVFSESQAWSFWMKNTRIPLDIVWLDRTKKVVHVAASVPICTRTDDSCQQYQSNEEAMFVLEVAGGRAEALGLKKGVTVKFDLPKTR